MRLCVNCEHIKCRIERYSIHDTTVYDTIQQNNPHYSTPLIYTPHYAILQIIIQSVPFPHHHAAHDSHSTPHTPTHPTISYSITLHCTIHVFTLHFLTIIRHMTPLASASSSKITGKREDFPHPVSPCIIVTLSRY